GAVAGGRGGGVVLWDVGRRARLVDSPLVVLEGWIHSVAFSPDGKTLAAGYGIDGGALDQVLGRKGVGGVVLWDVGTRTRLVDAPLAVTEGWVQSLAFSRDGRTPATGYGVGRGDGGVVLWDVGSRTRLVDAPLAVAEGPVHGVAFSPNGKTL